MSGPTLLALSLFIILLAFFIVLTSLSNFSEPKVEAAFQSLDLSFATNIRDTFAEEQTNDTTQAEEDGEGDSLEDIQATLKSLLPGLDINLTETPNGGQVMAIRMRKNKFEALSAQLIPILKRILNVKDETGDYELAITSYVRDVLDGSAIGSHNLINEYKNDLVKIGVNADRIILNLERGNPAYMQLRFASVIMQEDE
jgi:hypothetical protein